MTLTTIQKRIYRQCGLADSPATTDATRVLDFINKWYRTVLSQPGMDQLRDTTLSLTTVSGQAQYGLPQALSAVRDIFDLTNQRRIYKKTLDWLRRADPGLTATSATTDYWIPLNGWGAVQRPMVQTGTVLFVKSSSASDTQTAHVETTRLGGIRGGDSSALVNGVTGNFFGVLADHIEVTKFYLTTVAIGTVSLYDAASGGNLLAQITPGRTSSRYFMIQFYPTVSAALTLSLDCRRSMEDLTLPTEEPLLPEDYHQILVDGPLSEELRQRDSDQAKDYKASAMTLISDLRHSLYGNEDEIAVQRGPRRSAERMSRLGGYYPGGS